MGDAGGARAKAIRALVAVGLVLSVAVTVLMGGSAGELPGVAIGSPAMPGEPDTPQIGEQEFPRWERR